MMGLLRTPPRPKHETNQQNNLWSNERDYDSYDHDNYDSSFPPQQEKAQNRVFLASISSMHGNYEADLERKRRKQEEFALSLRKQIEEKKAREQVREPIAKQASEMLQEMQQEKAKAIPNYSQEPVKKVSFAPTIQLTPPNDLVFSQISETKNSHAHTTPIEKFVRFRSTFDADANHSQPKPIHVPTESPFARQNLGTPPLGFSIRRSQPVKIPLNIAPNVVQRRNLPHTKAKSSLSAPNPTFFDAARRVYMEDKEPMYPISSDSGDVYELKRLDSESELVYPDGHISQR
jgi:hypothetical protein